MRRFVEMKQYQNQASLKNCSINFTCEDFISSSEYFYILCSVITTTCIMHVGYELAGLTVHPTQ